MRAPLRTPSARLVWLLAATVGTIVLAGCSPGDPGPPRRQRETADGEATARAATAAIPASAETPPAAERADGYVADVVCSTCHARETEQWTGSHHDLAMQPATDETVLGDFDDATVSFDGVTTRFFRRDGGFWVRTEGPDGAVTDFPIRYAFGVVPLQQYLIAFPGGRLQCLTIAWDTGERRWFDLYPDEDIPAGDAMHWTGRYQCWNAMCAECHSTNLQERYDPGRDAYRTTWDEIDVGCQACHGPGADHVQWARDVEEGRAPTTRAALPIDYKANDAAYQVDACAPCHSRRHQVSPEDVPGEPYLDHFMPERLRAGLYHADGQILEEVYVYGSFIQSRMHAQGVRCTDCHDPHTARLIIPPDAPLDALCMRCHQEHPPDEFPTLKWLLYRKRYDAPEHHFHEPDTPGASCVECHMPSRTYMVVDPRRDHGFRVPRPDLTVRLGIPNACNDCHDDQTAEWAAEHVAAWYGTDRQQTPHFAVAFAMAREGRAEAIEPLRAVLADAEQSAIVRATAVELLRQYGAPVAATIVAACGDASPHVRAAAVGSLELLPEDVRVVTAAPLLRDPVGGVRFEAARVLAPVPREQLDATQRRDLDAALDRYRDTQLAVSDLPAGRLNVALLHQVRGRADMAESAYRTALRMDAAFLPASFNLANLYNATGQNDAAEAVLREALQHAPAATAEEGELRYSLGLVLAEEGRLADAAEMLGRAAELLPARARVHYNRALALQQLDQAGEAESSFLTVLDIAPDDPDTLYALAILYVQQQRWEDALPRAQRLAALFPESPEVRRLLQHVQER